MTGLDRMHAAMGGWPGRAAATAPFEGCESCRYWTGRATWRTVAHFLTFGFWQAPEWGLCRSRTSHLSRTKTWAMVACRSWRVVLRKGTPEPSDAEVARDLAGQRRAELAGELDRGTVFRSVVLGAVLIAAVGGGAGLVVAAIISELAR